MNVQFGSGVLFGIPNAGNTAVNPTPTKLGIMQNASVEFKSDNKKLFGQSQFAVATARGKMDVTGKATLALLDPNMMNQLFFGQGQTTGIKRLAIDDSYDTAGIVQVSGHANFVTDYGVVNGDTSLNMVKVASAPTVGQYAVDTTTGTYTFNAAETAATVLVSYLATDSAKGTTITLSNQLMGHAPICRVLLYNDFRGKNFSLELNAVTFGQISIPTKQEDFWTVDVSFDANCDASNVLGSIYADI